MSPSPKRRVLFGVSGSIAAFKACSVISELVKAGHEVQVATSPSALQFIGQATLEGLSHRPVYTDLFQSSRAMDHIELARWATDALVCPASANTLARCAHGFAEDPLSTLYLAWELSRKPWTFVPAMNPTMWSHPSTQKNIALLKSHGARVLEPEVGTLACGEQGAGRLPEPQQILMQVFDLISEPKGFS